MIAENCPVYVKPYQKAEKNLSEKCIISRPLKKEKGLKQLSIRTELSVDARMLKSLTSPLFYSAFVFFSSFYLKSIQILQARLYSFIN